MASTDSHPFEEAFEDLFRTLNQLPFPYCLMGALDLGAWGTPRATHDLDAMIAIGRTDRPQLLESLRVFRFTEDTLWADHNPMIKEFHVRLQRGAIPVDLMLPKDNHDQTCLARRRQYELDNLSLWIISPEDLVIHKLKAGRAQDFIDVLSVLQRQATSLNRDDITDWAKRLGIWEEWQYIQNQGENPRS
ncbi:MAG: hypothetical protein OEY28_04940 [Nitrospira sp.]|nr:hypothetical protein [Nitrospira sp.]